MSPPGRPTGESRSAQRKGHSMIRPDSPKGEPASAQREGRPVTGQRSRPAATGIHRGRGGT